MSFENVASLFFERLDFFLCSFCNSSLANPGFKYFLYIKLTISAYSVSTFVISKVLNKSQRSSTRAPMNGNTMSTATILGNQLICSFLYFLPPLKTVASRPFVLICSYFAVSFILKDVKKEIFRNGCSNPNKLQPFLIFS